MGCGAVCGDSTTIKPQPLKHSKSCMQKLLPLLGKSNHFLTEEICTKFVKEINENSIFYHLQVNEKIDSNQPLFQSILEKWKIILYGLDNNIEAYCNCLGFVQRRSRDSIEFVKISDELIDSCAIDHLSLQQQLPTIYPHDCFGQIEKDLDRTFQLPELKKKSFENVLKRISNHFPKMGYTQGINFVVGYLIIIGYSENDSFWIFTHIALNRRYMLLGLYQDGFPLSNVYSHVFKNMLKRLNQPLYEHLYEKLMLDGSLWVFKWFITYYLYSFPFQMCKYVLDIVIEVGGIGLVSFAVALTLQLGKQLIAINDPCDISEFFQSLKKLENFNKYLSIKCVVQRAYQLLPLNEDYEGVNKCYGGFYGNYFHALIEEQSQKDEGDDITRDTQFKQPKIQQKKSMKLLTEWYNRIIQERSIFIQKHKPAIPSGFQTKDVRQSIRHSRDSLDELNLPDAIDTLHYSESITFKNVPSINAEQNTIEETIPKFQSRRSACPSVRPKIYDTVQIDELWDQEDKNSKSDKNQSNVVDELDKFTQNQQSKAKASKVRQSEIQNSKYPYPDYENSRKPPIHKPKINNFNLYDKNEKRTGLSLAGQNVLYNISGTNSQHSESTSQKNQSVRSRKSTIKKQGQLNKNTRYCACAKIKTESHRLSHDKTSQRESSQQKKSISNISSSQDENLGDMIDSKVPQSVRERVNTQQQYMINSHGPQKISIQLPHLVEIGSEIQLFNGGHLFKKKNKQSRISGAIPQLGTTINIMKDKNKDETSFKMSYPHPSAHQIHKLDNQEESYQSIFIPASSGKRSQKNSGFIDPMAYQVESIK